MSMTLPPFGYPHDIQYIGNLLQCRPALFRGTIECPFDFTYIGIIILVWGDGLEENI